MTRTVSISGGSDDHVMIEGDLEEEHPTDSGVEGLRVTVSDGTVLALKLGDGGWHITVEQEGDGHVQLERAPVLGLDRDYTDRVTITGDDLAWVEVDDADGGRERFSLPLVGQ